LATTYGGWLDVVERATDELGASDRRAIMAGNAKRVYGLAM
jgi:predicted TIM-barrel fold metal-dependent hydrolase